MLNFDERTGPNLGVAYPDLTAPQWWRDAKLGFFIHLGLYSIPAWAVTDTSGVTEENEYAHHTYAEWYANTLRIPSPTQKYHAERFGADVSYEDFADMWEISAEALTNLVDVIASTGARYIVPTTKHHDGFCLWDTATTDFNSVRRGPRLDIIDTIAKRSRERGLRFGTYFSGGLDWHVSSFPPIQSNEDLFTLRRHDQEFAEYSAAQLTELIERFAPDILWNDIEWPDSGKGNEPYGLVTILSSYKERVPHGLINDRWGIPAHSYVTREYRRIDEKLDYPWEATRGLSHSFGYNANDTGENTLTGSQLITYFVDVVAKGGNLLINVGPRSDGSIPQLQLAAMSELGEWMSVYGDCIYGTTPYLSGIINSHAFLTKDNTIYICAKPGEKIQLPPELEGRKITWIGTEEAAEGYAPQSRFPVVVGKVEWR